MTDLILAATRSLPVAMGALGLYPSRNRGRVFAGYDMVWQTGRLISLGAGGLTADAVGIQVVYLLGGPFLLAGTIGLAMLQSVTRSRVGC